MADASEHLEPVEECLIKRTRKGRVHIDNCSTGYRPGLSFLWQSHHVLPVSAVASKHITDTPDGYIEKCLCVTDWDVNAAHNVIGLDTKWPYYLHPTQALPQNLPSHLIDHPDYTEESYLYMKRKVWSKLKKKRKQHKLDPKSITSELNAASDYFRGELISRGSRNGGTLKCWEKRHNEGMADKWYHPFSMSTNPRKRHPGSLEAFLPDLFKAIK